MIIVNKHNKIAVASLILMVAVSGCSSSMKTEVRSPTIVEYQVRNVPGAVEYIWEEPMVDVVSVPPGLDPEGHYYRPAHQEVTEIRQGRWQYYRRPGK